MKKLIENEIFRGWLIGLLGVDIFITVIRGTHLFADFGLGVNTSAYATSVRIVIGLVLFATIMRSAGHYRGKEAVTPNYFDKVPLELYLLVDGAVIATSGALTAYLFHYRWGFEVIFVSLSICYLASIFLCTSIAVRCKTYTLLTNTFTWRFFSAVGRFVVGIWHSICFYITSLPLYWQTAAAIAVLTLISLLLWPVGPFIAAAIAVVVFGRIHMAWGRIATGIEKIARGDTDYKVDTHRMPKEIAAHAENLNNINIIVSNAVNERMKGERLKTELITNVSHDIKTPLTSIINYIDLIQKENITRQPMADYVNVLQRQSDRLKKLIDDLVEASKASTGNIAVHLSTTGVNLLLNQAVGEYMDKAENRNLELSLNLPGEEMYVLSDGRLLWRIFDNLLNNACKYSRPGTRIYINAQKDGDKAVITFKNVSRTQLNISPDELMERFVRGDSSRNTEGSGLGLSIAQSLTEILNGHMVLEIDGDLFKAVLTFDMI
ncbi:MAG: HAMP domain-containing histidine kinase [Oscillospiraceae bacterium]|nr:HAMP domain-containing histidine kinase [Oscillospiraceae bacterium]